jgi:hypothetical protein
MNQLIRHCTYYSVQFGFQDAVYFSCSFSHDAAKRDQTHKTLLKKNSNGWLHASIVIALCTVNEGSIFD